MNNNIGKVVWFVTGAGVGAGLVWLYGTKSGRRMRRRVAEAVEDGKEQLYDTSHEVLEKGKEFVERGKDFLGETRETLGRVASFAKR